MFLCRLSASTCATTLQIFRLGPGDDPDPNDADPAGADTFMLILLVLILILTMVYSDDGDLCDHA